VMPGSKRRVVADAKDLKPFNVSDLRCTQAPDMSRRRFPAADSGEGFDAAEGNLPPRLPESVQASEECLTALTRAQTRMR
jgi:hypothetical protein